MIRNHIKTAFRSLLKNKGFTFINILGLALGFASCLLIVFYVIDELSYDRYNIKADRIYRVSTDLKLSGGEAHFAITAPPVGETLVKEFPEVERSMRIAQGVNIRFQKSGEIIEEKNAFYCDNSVFSIFTLPFIKGNAKIGLTEPNTMVISRTTALKYFNSTNVVGEILLLTSDSTFHKVTGVMEDMPVQSHFRADIFLSMEPNKDQNWGGFSISTYILLKPGTNQTILEAKFPALIQRHENSPTFNYDKFQAKGNYIRLSLIPVTDIHLHSNRQRELAVNGNVEYVYIFSVIALSILVLACINFMNLSTARSANRAREVGVRKVLGSSRKHLIVQFLSESIMVTFAATIIAVLTAWVLLQLFNQLSGKTLTITFQTFMWLLPALLFVIIIVGILAGSYPAFFLSAFQPIAVLKGKIATGFKNGFLRSFLVVFQFSISIFLIIGTLVIYNQINYIRNKNLGFNRNQVFIVKNVTALPNPKAFKEQIKALPGVVNATLSVYLPTNGASFPNYVDNKSGKSIQTQFWMVDEDYIGTMGMQIVQGRNFSHDFLTDTAALVINQTMAKAIDYKGDRETRIKGLDKSYHIIGVVKDFNFNSLRDNVSPLVLSIRHDWMSALNIKVSAANLHSTLDRIENKWKQFSPNQHFEYSFMDEQFNAMYQNELRMGQLFIIFTTLAIIIACLGLFGLAAYAAEQRNREIGIRKVLGAGVTTLVAMLSKSLLSWCLSPSSFRLRWPGWLCISGYKASPTGEIFNGGNLLLPGLRLCLSLSSPSAFNLSKRQ